MIGRISKVRKRDGRLVDFDESKIADAIHKAACAVGREDRFLADELAGVVTLFLEKRYSGSVPGIEEIQDMVERVLIETGHARAYSTLTAQFVHNDTNCVGCHVTGWQDEGGFGGVRVRGAAVDLVVQVGAPKGVSRLLQRIGRANHRLDRPSRALLVPANRFEVLECRAALEGIMAGTLDGEPPKVGGLDVLAQHILGTACSGPFEPDALYREVTRAAPYAALSREDFDDVLAFVADGGYALRTYERYRRLKRDEAGRYRVAGPAHLRRYRMNVGTIVEAPTVKVKLKRGRVLGEVEEYFVQWLTPGDSFLFAGELLTFEGLREATEDVLAGLTPREAKVLRMRFGIDMNTDHTLEEVGKQFDVTRERIRQIEAKALRKLRHPSRSEQLRSFLD